MASGTSLWAALGVLVCVGGAGAALAYRQLAAPQPAPRAPVAVASAAAEPAAAPLATLIPAVSSAAARPAIANKPSEPSAADPAKAGAAKTATKSVPVSVSVSRVDATMTTASALVAFVAPARACFDRAKMRTGIELHFSASGQLVETNYARSEADSPTSCVQSRIDALKGSTPAGYVGGRASTAELQMGS